MFIVKGRQPVTVSRQGALADSVLCGCGGNNQGLRLRISLDQAKGDSGPIQGDFVILDVGDNKHSLTLEPLLHRVTNAQEVLGLIRSHYSSCVNVANANVLAKEQEPLPGRQQPEGERPRLQAERRPPREEGTVSDPDQYGPSSHPAVGQPSPQRVEIVSNPDF